MGADLAPREVARRHPAYDSERPPLERNITPWPPEVSRNALPPVIQAPPMPAPRPSMFARGAPSWAIGIATIITTLGTAFGGMAYVVSQWRKDAAEQTVAANTKIDVRLAAIEGALRTALDDQQARDIVNLSVLCELNGGPPARGVRCPPNACEPRALDPSGKEFPGQPRCKATVDWPPIRRSP